jgi:hypothetical protein
MQAYQIRIVKNNRETETEDCKLASDYAVIRHGRNMAEDCEHIEVWRCSHCVLDEAIICMTSAAMLDDQAIS